LSSSLLVDILVNTHHATRIMSLSSKQLRKLLDVLLKRSFVLFPKQLRERIALETYLKKLFLAAPPSLAWLIEPLYYGILKGHPFINTFIAQDPRLPILFWVCRWKLLKVKYGWKHVDKRLVALVLDTPGIQVNIKLPLTHINAAFLAVKYACPSTLKYLIAKRIHMKQREKGSRFTCLFNALEYPSPKMLAVVLKNVPVSEIFVIQYVDGTQCVRTAADRILTLYTDHDEWPSWIQLGDPPPVEDVAECLLRIMQQLQKQRRQQGAQVVGAGVSLTSQSSQAALVAMGIAFQGGTELTEARKRIRQPKQLVKLGRALMGSWLPDEIQCEIEEFDQVMINKAQVQGNEEEEEKCRICESSFHKPIALYCGHRYCRRCIVSHAKRQNKTTCPACHSQLCKDIRRYANDDDGEGNQGNSLFDVVSLEAEQERNIMSLSDHQISEEMRAQGIFSALFSSYHRQRTKLLDTVRNGNSEEILELSATNSIFDGNNRILSPAGGPVVVEISVKGIPLLARISNNSRYTIVSKSVAKTFTLKRIEKLSSKKFRDGLTKKRISKYVSLTCLDRFEFEIGGIDVVLRNAVEASPDLDGIGIQLGQDFFMSGRFCVADVNISVTSGEGKVGYRTDGLFSWNTKATAERIESLRYYSHHGHFCSVPLLHFNPHKNPSAQVLTLKLDVAFTECSWCCRVFPEGMGQCRLCDGHGDEGFYCDEDCQRAAFKIHRKCHKEQSA